MNQALRFIAAAAVGVAVTVAVTQARSEGWNSPLQYAQISPFDRPGPWVVRVDVVSKTVDGYLQSDDTFDNRERCETYAGSDDFAGVLTRIWAEMRKNHGDDLKLRNIRCEPTTPA